MKENIIFLVEMKHVNIEEKEALEEWPNFEY